jgi:hypothetical protein
MGWGSSDSRVSRATYKSPKKTCVASSASLTTLHPSRTYLQSWHVRAVVLVQASRPEKDTLGIVCGFGVGHCLALNQGQWQDSMEPGSVESNMWRPSPQNVGVKANAHGQSAAGYTRWHICNLGMFERWFWFRPLNQTPSEVRGPCYGVKRELHADLEQAKTHKHQHQI